MKSIFFGLSLPLVLLISIYAHVCAATGEPSVFLPQTRFQSDPVVEGGEVKHEFIIKNTGNAPLKIHKVSSG